jgi:diaminopimelate epimerase
MHGLGNDFAVLDLRACDLRVDARMARTLADRRTGIGCDQVISLEPSDKADAFMRIHNPGGDEAEACGNGTRCAASLLGAELQRTEVALETLGGVLPATFVGDGRIRVDMGPVRLAWHDIPLAREADTLHVDLSSVGAALPFASDSCCVNVGNPHATLFLDDVENAPVEDWGPALEHHPDLPQRANIEFVQIITPDKIRMRVWERTAGVTRACGSGACAAAIAAIRRGYCERQVEVVLDGGPLSIEWRDSDGHVLMTGPVATVYRGEIDESLLSGGKADGAAA